MTQWTENRVNTAEELEQRCIDRWEELWEFNGGVEPKFWFGDQVKYLGRSATILGLNWVKDKVSKKRGGAMTDGWWYLLLVEGGDGSLPQVHESTLRAIAQTKKNLKTRGNHD